MMLRFAPRTMKRSTEPRCPALLCRHRAAGSLAAVLARGSSARADVVALNRDLDAAVGGAAFGARVVGAWARGAGALHLDAVGLHAVPDERIPYGLRALGRELHVVGALSEVVGVGGDGDLAGVLVDQI